MVLPVWFPLGRWENHLLFLSVMMVPILRSTQGLAALSLCASSASLLTSPRRILETQPQAEEVRHTTESHRRVAIIGGGIAGLSCAHHLVLSSSSSLTQPRFNVTVFDTGRLRPGGRLSSRLPGDPPTRDTEDSNSGNGVPEPFYHHLSKCVIDHAAQMIPLPIDNSGMQDFVEQVLKWEKEGVVIRFPDHSLYDIVESSPEQKQQVIREDEHSPSPMFQLRPFPNSRNVFHGNGGNGAIPLAMAKTANDKKSDCFRLVQDVWVSPSNGVRYMTKSKEWKVQVQGQVLGYFDILICAHNGKCADRLMSKTPAKQVHRLLKVKFAVTVPKNGGKRMTLNSLYSLTFALRRPGSITESLPKSFVSGYIRNEPTLRFLSCPSRKYPLSSSSSSRQSNQDEVEVWTVLSSANFAKKHKAPQEFLPPETVENVTALLLQGVERSLGLQSDSLRPLESRLQLWGAAVPLNTWESSSRSSSTTVDEEARHGDDRDTNIGFIYDQKYSVGVCGDWLVQPSVAGAWTSGKRLADHLLMKGSPSRRRQGDDTQFDPETVGLEGRFVRAEEAHQGGIASFS